MDLRSIEIQLRQLSQGSFDWGEVGENFRRWLMPFEVRFIFFIILLICFIVFNLLLLYRRKHVAPFSSARIKKHRTKIFKKDILFVKKGSSPKLHIPLLLNIFFLFSILFLGITTLAMKPMVVSSSPLPESYMRSSHQRIEMEFDIPVDVEELKFNISPDIKGDWVLEPASSLEPFKRKVFFYPKESIPPENEVVVYLVGIRQWWWSGKLHEQSIEFKSPRIPKVGEFSIQNEEKNVPVNLPIQIKYDAPIGDFVKIAYQIEPTVNFEVDQVDESTQRLRFPDMLQQDTKYSIKVLVTPRSYDVITKEDIDLGETIEASEIYFETVTTPFIESISPKGSSVLSSSEIKITFDQPMDPNSVESNFSITPEIEGDFIWIDDKSMLFKPLSELPKDTKFEVKLGVGIASSLSGVVNKEIIHNFETIGKVKVISTSPVSGTNGHNPETTNIVVQFDQEVDKASAESKFIISPTVNGTFSWDGNNMIYTSGGKLTYATKYSYSIKPGVKSINGIDSDATFSYSFTTKANYFTLAIPQYYQQEGFTCNVSATRMALAYRGISVREVDVKNGVGIGTNPNQDWVPGYGVHWGPIASYIGQYRQVSIKTGWNTPALAAEVEKGNPVILWWYNRFSQGGYFTLDSGVQGLHGMHSEVVEGFYGDVSNPTHIITNDPWRGHQVYSRSVFESTWSYLNKTAVVVY